MDLVNLNTARTTSCFRNRKNPKKYSISETTSETRFPSLFPIPRRKCFHATLQEQQTVTSLALIQQSITLGNAPSQPRGPGWVTCSRARTVLHLLNENVRDDEFANVFFFFLIVFSHISNPKGIILNGVKGKWGVWRVILYPYIYKENFKCLIHIKAKHFPFACHFKVFFPRNTLLFSVPGSVTLAGLVQKTVLLWKEQIGCKVFKFAVPRGDVIGHLYFTVFNTGFFQLGAIIL